MKKALAMILALCMMALLFCGCDREEDTSTDSVVTPDESEITSVTVRGYMDKISDLAGSFGFENPIIFKGKRTTSTYFVNYNFRIFNDTLSFDVQEYKGAVESITVGGMWNDFQSEGKSTADVIDFATTVSVAAIASCTEVENVAEFQDKLLATPVQDGEYTSYSYSEGVWRYSVIIGPEVFDVSAYINNSI